MSAELIHLRRLGWKRVDDPRTGLAHARSNHAGGSFQFQGETTTLANLAYIAHHGRLPLTSRAVQRCGDERCINPKHIGLEWPPQRLSPVAASARNVGRAKPGKTHRGNKGTGRGKRLSSKEAAKVKEAIAEGFTNREIAARFGVTHTAVSKIKNGHSHA